MDESKMTCEMERGGEGTGTDEKEQGYRRRRNRDRKGEGERAGETDARRRRIETVRRKVETGAE